MGPRCIQVLEGAIASKELRETCLEAREASVVPISMDAALFWTVAKEMRHFLVDILPRTSILPDGAGAPDIAAIYGTAMPTVTGCKFVVVIAGTRLPVASEFSRKGRGYVSRAAGQFAGGTRYTPRFGIDQLPATHPRGKMGPQNLATYLGRAGHDATRTTPFFRGDRWVPGELGFCDGGWDDVFGFELPDEETEEAEGNKTRLKEAWHLFNASQHFGEYITAPRGIVSACAVIEELKPQQYATSAKLQKRYKHAVLMLRAEAEANGKCDKDTDDTVSIGEVISVEEQIAKKQKICEDDGALVDLTI